MSTPGASGPAQLPALCLHVAAQPSLPRVCSLEAWVLSVTAGHPAHEMSPRGQRLALSPSPQGFFLLNSPSGPEEVGTCPVRMSAGLPLHRHLSSGPLTCSPSIQSGKLCFPGSHLAPVEAPGRQLPNTISTVLTTLLLLNRSVVPDCKPCRRLRSPPGSSVDGFLQPRILERVAMSSCRGSSRPRDRTRISCVSCFGRWVLYARATREACGCRSSVNTC